MKAARAKVVKGKIVTRDKTTPFVLNSDEEAAMRRGIASIKAGRGISLNEFRAILRRL